MARKQQGLDDIFKRTEAGESEVDLSDLDKGNIQSTGVGLRKGEIEALDSVGRSLGDPPVARNALIRWAVRYFLRDYRAGKIDLSGFVEEPPPPRKSLRFPGQE